MKYCRFLKKNFSLTSLYNSIRRQKIKRCNAFICKYQNFARLLFFLASNRDLNRKWFECRFGTFK